MAAILNLATAGTVTFQDVDLIDTHTATFALKSSTSSAHLPGYVDNTSQIGTFALTSGPTGVNENTADTVNTATVGWSYTLADNDPVLQSLALGETLTQVYTVTITDNNGAQVTQDVTVTLVGTNDTPTIVSASNDTPSLTEDSVAAILNLATAGTVTFQDVDLIDTHTATFALKSSTSSAHLPGYVDNTSQIGTFALTSGPTGVNENTADTVNTATVGWSYTLADNDPVLQSLALGETLTQVYTVTITDNNGAQVTQDVTVTLAGTNDTPTIVSASNDTPSLTEEFGGGDPQSGDGGDGHVPGRRPDRHPYRDVCAEVVDLERASAGLCRQHQPDRDVCADVGADGGQREHRRHRQHRDGWLELYAGGQ